MNPNVRWLGLGGSLRALGLSMVAPFLALYLRNELGLGYVEIGLLTVVTGVAPLLVSPLGGFITDRLGRRSVFLVTLSLETGSMFLLAYFLEI
ncbi:MAG: MFS transporter, partial [Thermoplasmata archaeon]